MKLIIAVIKPEKLDTVREGLAEIGVHGMSAMDIRGHGRQRGHREVYRGAEYEVHFVPKTRIEIAVDAQSAEKAVVKIRECAGAGQIGDGKIFVLDLEQAVRIRTGETGRDAL